MCTSKNTLDPFSGLPRAMRMAESLFAEVYFLWHFRRHSLRPKPTNHLLCIESFLSETTDPYQWAIIHKLTGKQRDLIRIWSATKTILQSGSTSQYLECAEYELIVSFFPQTNGFSMCPRVPFSSSYVPAVDDWFRRSG